MNREALTSHPTSKRWTRFHSAFDPVVHLFMTFGVLFFLCVSPAFATPAPLDCQGEPSLGFEVAYPDLPIGIYGWILLIFGVVLIIHAHLSARRGLNDEAYQRHKLKILIMTVISSVFLIGSVMVWLLMLVAGVFRTDCMFCTVDRPTLGALDELKLVVTTIIPVMGLRWIFRLIPSTLISHGFTIFLIPIGLMIWIALVRFAANDYLTTYCQAGF